MTDSTVELWWKCFTKFTCKTIDICDHDSKEWLKAPYSCDIIFGTCRKSQSDDDSDGGIVAM